MAKPKKVKVDLLNPEHNQEPFALLQKMRAAHHPDTSSASIALAWMLETKCDADGRLVLGKCVRTTDLQREFAAYDFVILLNKEVWESYEFTEDKKCALLDHELMHAAEAVDSEGSAKWDSKGRRVWRIRKHDIEEFHDVVRRHGCYKRDLQQFAEAILKKRGNPLFVMQPESGETTAYTQ